MVRHEAAEAVGAIGCEDYENMMKKMEEEDPHIEVRETAHLAYQRIIFFKNRMGDEYQHNAFGSGSYAIIIN